MSETKITDLVPKETLEELETLNKKMQEVVDKYTAVAKELANGLTIPVKTLGDADKINDELIKKTKEAAELQKQLTSLMERKAQVIANTTPVLSRNLMEQERINKANRDEYKDGSKVTQMVEKIAESYENNTRLLAKYDMQIKANKKSQSDLEKQYKSNLITEDEYIERQAELLAEARKLAVEKSNLTQVMKIEEKLASDNAGSYSSLSHQLELLKNQYKQMDDSMRESEVGQEFERVIQDLDAHLKDMAADMGEFQRNVGNYAIAGQNGVVSTESLTAAVTQEAKTMQDLVDQTKILEEAKTLLNQNDEHYQENLDMLNAKLEENKARLLDVTDILDKKAKTVTEAEAQNKRLEEALRNVDLTADDAQETIKKYTDKIAENNGLIDDSLPSLGKQSHYLKEIQDANEDAADSVLGLIGVNSDFASSLECIELRGDVFEGLKTKVQAFFKTTMGLLANPWLLTFLGIAGGVVVFKWWYDYNKGLIEASRLTQNFTGLTGEAADKITTDLQAVADHMGKSFEDTIGAANTLVQQCGISWEEAISKIEDGIEAGADMNGTFIESIDQYAPALRDAGVSVDEFVSILAETRNGIFDEKGVDDIIKGGTRLRAMTKQIAASLDACGISSKQMQKDLTEGNITMLEAIQQVASKLEELPENSQEAGQLMKNVFGRTAAEGGTLLIQSIADINTNLDVAKERMGELGKLNREQIDAQKELNEIIAALFKMSGTKFEEMTIQAKVFITRGLTEMIKGCVDLANKVVRLYNEVSAFRYLMALVISLFKTTWEVIKGVVDLGVNGFQILGGAVKGFLMVLSGDIEAGYKKMYSSITEGVKKHVGIFVKTAKDIGSDWGESFSQAAEGKLKEFSTELNFDSPTGDHMETRQPVTSEYVSEESEEEKKAREKAAKEAEKAAKEQLKILQQLEESKIAMMQDGHEKQLATIRLNYKKKLDAITGDSENEKALRLQLLDQMEKELEDCEKTYQKELSKINLENRLASVKEGSKEELDLKLAQLEANRLEEIKAAEKTGADLFLIEEKYEKMRLDLKEGYAQKRIEQIQKAYANEGNEANNSQIRRINELTAQYARDLQAAKGNADKKEEIEREYNRKMDNLNADFAINSVQREISMMEELLGISNLSAEERLKLEQDLASKKLELESLVNDKIISGIEDADAREEEMWRKRKERITNWLQIASDALSSFNDLAQAIFDSQIERIEEQQEANTAAGEKEQERISQLVEQKVITEEEGEARKRAAEAQTAKKNEELERKKAALQRKQAVFQKATDLAQAGISTALAITNALTTSPFPLGLAMAAIAGAMGAVQIATIAATPIPKYKHGTDSHKGGPAIVGDGGIPEVVLFGGQAWLTPDKPTLVDIPQGAVVIPSIEKFAMQDNSDIPSMMNNNHVVINNDYSDLKREVVAVGGLIRQQTRQQRKLDYLRNYELFKLSKI